MHECYAMQILDTKKTKNQKTMVTKNIAMKHKDYVRKTQLDWAFCIQNFLDAPRVLIHMGMISNSRIRIKV